MNVAAGRFGDGTGDAIVRLLPHTQGARQVELAAESIRVGLVYPWIMATDFAANRAAVESRGDDRLRTIQGDTADDVAELIREAVRMEAAEVYAANVKRMMESSTGGPGDRPRHARRPSTTLYNQRGLS